MVSASPVMFQHKTKILVGQEKKRANHIILSGDFRLPVSMEN